MTGDRQLTVRRTLGTIGCEKAQDTQKWGQKRGEETKQQAGCPVELCAMGLWRPRNHPSPPPAWP